MSKRKAPVGVVNHIHVNTMNAYFGKVVGPAPSPEPDPNAWLPKDEPGRPTKRLRTGELRATCAEGAKSKGCPKKLPQGLANFVPRQSPTDAKAFIEALEGYAFALGARDVDAMETHRLVLEELRVQKCDHCRDKLAESQLEGPNNQTANCKREWQRIQREVLVCCVKCGGTRALEANHLDTATKKRDANGKPVQLSAYGLWPALGGPPAMREEAELCECLCAMDHRLDDHTAAANRVDPATLGPPVRCSEDEQLYDKQRKAAIKWPKYQYVDAIKRKIGRCENANCPCDGLAKGLCTLGFEVCFDFHHVDNGATKAVDANGKSRCIAQMCADLRIRPEEEWKTEIDDELLKTRMLCRNCHHLATWHKLEIEYISRPLVVHHHE